MLYFNKYLIRKKGKYLPLLITTVLLVALITYFHNFSNIFKVQREQFFSEQYNYFNRITFEKDIIERQIKTLEQDFNGQLTIRSNVTVIPEHLLFGRSYAELYHISREDYQKLVNEISYLPEEIDRQSAQIAIVTSSLKKSSPYIEGEKISYKDMSMPVIEFESRGKYGFIVKDIIEPGSLLVFELFNQNERAEVLTKYSFIDRVLNRQFYVKRMEDDLSFIQTTLSICITTIFLINQLLIGISTYLTVQQRVGEIGIYNVLGIAKRKVILKFIYELMAVSLAGIFGGIIISGLIWHYTMTPILARSGTIMDYNLPRLIIAFPICSLIIGLVIIIKIARTVNPIDIILKQTETKVF